MKRFIASMKRFIITLINKSFIVFKNLPLREILKSLPMGKLKKIKERIELHL